MGTKKKNILKDFKPSVRDRTDIKRAFINSLQGDTVKCLGCGLEFHPPEYRGLHAHHILVVEKFPELFWELERFGYPTVVPLCRKCHNKVHWALFASRKSRGKPV